MNEETINSPASNERINETYPTTSSSELSSPDPPKIDNDSLEELQKQKLKAEIADLKRPLWKKVTFWPPVLTFLTAVLVYFYLLKTGILEEKQAHLTYVTDTLRLYKNHLDTTVKIQKDSSKILAAEISQKNVTIDSLYRTIGLNRDLINQYKFTLNLNDSDLRKKSPYVAGLLLQIRDLKTQKIELQKATDYYSTFAQRSVYAYNSDCKIVDVSKIPGYSDRSRYFRMDRGSSFILGSRGFGVYLGGPGDSYTWDSVRQCQGKYVMYFTKGMPQEVMPYSAAFEFERHHVTILNPVGILDGRYDLLFDFEQNENSNVVPKLDVGTWRIFNYPNRIIIHAAKTIEFGDSAHLEQFKIDHIKVDRIDNSELYFTHSADNNQQQFLIQHGPKLTIILFGPDRPELYPFSVMSKL